MHTATHTTSIYIFYSVSILNLYHTLIFILFPCCFNAILVLILCSLYTISVLFLHYFLTISTLKLFLNLFWTCSILGVGLDGSFTAVFSIEELKSAIKDYWFSQVAGKYIWFTFYFIHTVICNNSLMNFLILLIVQWQAAELQLQEKAPFSYRYWG